MHPYHPSRREFARLLGAAVGSWAIAPGLTRAAAPAPPGGLNLVVDIGGLCALVPCKTKGADGKLNSELRVLMLDPFQPNHTGQHGAMPPHDAILSVPYEMTEDSPREKEVGDPARNPENNPDEIVQTPEGTPMCLWHLRGYELRFGKAGSGQVAVTENIRKKDPKRPGYYLSTTPGGTDGKDFSWIPNLQRVWGDGEADPERVGGPLSPPVSARVAFAEGTLEAVMDKETSGRKFRFGPRSPKSTFDEEALAKRARLTIRLPATPRALNLHLVPIEKGQSPREIHLYCRGAKDLGLGLGCFPAELYPTNSHFAAFYDLLARPPVNKPDQELPVPAEVGARGKLVAEEVGPNGKFMMPKHDCFPGALSLADPIS